MSLIFENVICLLHGHRLSRFSNKFSIGPKRSTHDVTSLEDQGRRWLKGDWEGDWNFDLYDQAGSDLKILQLLADNRTDHEVVILPAGAEPGKLGMFLRGPVANFSKEGVAGEPTKVACGGKLEGAGPSMAHVLFGGIHVDSEEGALPVTEAVDGDPVGIVTLGPGQKLTCIQHVADYPMLVGADVSLTGKLQSAVGAGFTSAQDIHTFDPVTQANAASHVQRFTVSGDVFQNTDTFYRWSVSDFASTDAAAQVAVVVYMIIEMVD